MYSQNCMENAMSRCNGYGFNYKALLYDERETESVAWSGRASEFERREIKGGKGPVFNKGARRPSARLLALTSCTLAEEADNEEDKEVKLSTKRGLLSRLREPALIHQGSTNQLLVVLL